MNNISVNQVNIPDLNIDFVRSLPRVEYRYRADLPTEKGAYFICVEHPHFQILYVGQSLNFKSRLDRHSRRGEFDAVLLTQPVWIHYLSLNWERMDIEILEYALIRKLSPALNVANAMDGVIVLPELSEEQQRAIAVGISKSLSSHSLQELSGILEKIGINLGSTRKSKVWMTTTIRRVLGREGKRLDVHDLDEYRKGKLTEKCVVSLKDIEHNLSTTTDVRLEEVNKIDYKDPLTYKEIGIRKMKKIASALEISGYSIMTKDELAARISAISHHMNGE